MTHQISSLERFRQERSISHARLMETEHLGLKRFLNLDTAAYRDGAIPGKVKELLGLVASLVLRCDECINYHLEQCVGRGYRDEELEDAMNVALVVGGSIVIPHLRRARLMLDQLLAEVDNGRSVGTPNGPD